MLNTVNKKYSFRTFSSNKSYTGSYIIRVRFHKNSQLKPTFGPKKQNYFYKTLFFNNKKYSTGKEFVKHNFLSDLLQKINVSNYKQNTFETQKYIESLLFDSFQEIFLEKGEKKVLVAGINTELLGSLVYTHIQDKTDLLKTYIKKMLDPANFTGKKTIDLFEKEIISHLDEKFLFNLCLVTFLQVYTHQQSDNNKEYVLVPVIVKMGKKMVSLYLNKLKDIQIKEKQGCNKLVTLYSEFKLSWEKSNPEFAQTLDDNLYARLGCIVIDILEHSEMIYKELNQVDYKKKEYVLKITNYKLLNSKKHKQIFNIPTKLPMVCTPKPYTNDKIGGYLLNDVLYFEDLFIDKKGYKFPSVLSNNNNIYDMVNTISSTPFKVNTELLNYLMVNGAKKDLIIDPTVEHELEKLDNLRALQKKKLASYNSKKILQESILAIAYLYSNFSKFYFPVRLDQRGRLYCTPNYFNYQSTELAKALILFADPSIISKTDTESINYLICYGVNCFGGKISKQPLSKKLDWIQNNRHNIINFDNGVLLDKAKDKLLFLSFCMEYKRYVEFMEDEDMLEFYTYLPIQLDATCNGFQHMALLSNETTLFKELNLVKKTTEEAESIPSDFYNFLLHKLIDKFSETLDKNILIDEKTGGSYERLNKFMWDRSFIKKAVMTIPYNSSSRSMVDYIISNLVEINCTKDNCAWFSDTEKNNKTCINIKDIRLLVSTLKNIINNDFEKIRKLTKYLKNISSLLYKIELPIVWTLPTGLTIKQSYLETKSTTITPFIHSKVKLNLKITVKDKFDKNKQIRALMPNLIHSLDATSMALLYNRFSTVYKQKGVQFFSIHDCFGTTCDKVFVLKSILASVYTDLYSSTMYLLKFDNCILDYIENNTPYKIDRKARLILLPDMIYQIHDVEWVVNKKFISAKEVRRIDMQHILI